MEDVSSSSSLSLPAAEKADRLWANCLADSRPSAYPSSAMTGLGFTFLQVGPTGFDHRNMIMDCDLQGWAKEWSLGCVNSRPEARGSQEAGFT